ncbi:MAG: sulfite exporter TauE/SafE family protein [Burkholderiaceae bacterium]
MNLDLGWPLVLELLALGAATGYVAGLLGVGGGMLMVPFMTLLLTSRGMPAQHVVKMALATSLATICFTSIASVRAHARQGAVRWDLVRLLAPGILLGGLLGAQLAIALPARLLAVLFALFVSVSAVQMILNKKPSPTRRLPGGVGLFGVGGGIGAVSALVGAGGAFLSVPFMIACNLPIHTAVATAAAVGFPIALAGTVGYAIGGWSLADMPAGTVGYLYVPALLTIAAASVLTAPMGARMAHRLDVAQLKRVFAALLVVLATYMYYQGLHG